MLNGLCNCVGTAAIILGLLHRRNGFLYNTFFYTHALMHPYIFVMIVSLGTNRKK